MAKSSTPLCVCIISGGSPKNIGGLASYMRFLSQHLSKDCAISVVSRFTRHDPAKDMYSGFQQPEVVDNGAYQIRVISSRPLWRPLLRRLRSLVSRTPLQKLALWIYNQAYRKSISTSIPQKVDVIHFVGVGWELLGFLALAEARKRAAVFTMWPAVHPGTWGDSPLDVTLYNQADAVFVQSDSEKAHLTRLGVNPTRLHLCGLAPATDAVGNEERFRHQHSLGTRPLILFVGRKDKGKGYHSLCAAMPLVLAVVPDACLVAVGPDREPPYPVVPEKALLDLGFASEDDKADALAACTLFCLPSENEAFGIVYVEAWHYSKPIIGGPAPAVHDLITEGINGFCVPQDKDAIALALIRLLRDPALCQSVGAEGHKTQQECFTWEAVVGKHLSVFRDTLSARQSQSTGNAR